MIYVHSLGRASRYYPQRTALVVNGAVVSFKALDERVQNIVAALAAKGFRAGDRLALLLPNSPEYIELVYACSWLGVTAVPINARLSATEIDRVLADANPHGLVRHSSLPKPTVQLPWQLVLDEKPFDVRNESCPDPVYDPEAILALIYTSGTTGRPKGVMVTHANILANVDHFSYWMGYREGGVYLHAAPIFHIADFPAMFAAPAFGASQVTIPKFSPEAFGELVARGANVMRAYWNNPQDTALAFRNGMFRTGDIGYRDSDGYFYILDRLKDMIVTGGENVYSGEVEAVLYGHPAVREAAVFGIPDPQCGELVMACVGVQPGMALSADDLTSHCRPYLANYNIPRRVDAS